MTLLDRHITRAFLAVWIRTVVALIGLYVLIDLLTARRVEIAEFDVPWTVVVQYYLFFIPRLLGEYQIAALAVLISGLLVMGKLAQRSELTAMLAGGIGLWRIVVAPALFTLLISGALFLLGESLAPRSAEYVGHLEREYFGEGAEELETPPGVLWADLPDGWKCDIRAFDRVALSGSNVLMYVEKPERHEQIRADHIFWDSSAEQWIIENGTWSIFYPQNTMNRESRAVEREAAPFQTAPETLMTADVDTATLSMTQLNRLRKEHSIQSRTGRRLAVDYYGRFSEPMLAFVMIWLAIPFSIRLGRGSRTMGFGITLAIGLTYLIVFSITQTLGYAGQIPPMAAATTANTLFLTTGLAIFSRTPT